MRIALIIVAAVLVQTSGARGAPIQMPVLDIADPLFPSSFGAGDVFSFDIVIADGMGYDSSAAQITLSLTPVGHAGTLIFDQASSAAVSELTEYWLFNNSVGAFAGQSTGTCFFGDNADNPTTAPLTDGAVVARFAFQWDGIPGDYVIDVDNSVQNTFVMLDLATKVPDWMEEPKTIYVPEPAAAALLLLGVSILVRRVRS